MEKINIRQKKARKECSAREISIQEEGDGTACAVVNQLWAWLFTNSKKYFKIAPTANSTVG